MAKLDHTRQMDMTASQLTKDVQQYITIHGHIKGIERVRMSELIQRDFLSAHNYELIQICNAFGMYLYQFEEKYSKTLIVD
jgi:hypothetical protein